MKVAASPSRSCSLLGMKGMRRRYCSGVLRRLMILVVLRLDLEGAVLDVEVTAEAVSELVEDPLGIPDHAGVGHHDVGRQHRDAAGDGPGMQVVHAGHT